MTKRILLLLLIVATSMIPSASEGMPSVDSVIALNYPAQLVAFSAEHHLTDARQQTYATFSVGGDDFVIAAYSNGDIGAVLLFLRQGTTYSVVDAPTAKYLGKDAVIRLLDLDGDSTLEAVVEFQTGHGWTGGWIFRIENRHLRLMTGTDKYGNTQILVPKFVSMGPSGALDIVTDRLSGVRPDWLVTHHHFALLNGRYAEAAPLDFFQLFYRSSASPQTEMVDADIAADALGKPYRLVISNGGQSGADYRVSSGEVRLNGILVAGPSDFGQNRVAWTIPVSLQQHNVISVRLEGKPSGRIAVAVRHD